MANKKYYVRKFLNKKEGIAAIEIDGTCKDKFDDGFSVKLSDCNRQITLDFWADSKQDYKEKLDKVNLIISELTKVKHWIQDNSKYAEADSSNVPD